jgi:hypothetical protein
MTTKKQRWNYSHTHTHTQTLKLRGEKRWNVASLRFSSSGWFAKRYRDVVASCL